MTDEIQGDLVPELSLPARFLLAPTPELFRELSDEVVRSRNYQPSAQPMRIGSGLAQQGQAAAVLAGLESLLPGAFLNPGTHLLLSEAHRQLGQPEEAEREAVWYRATMSGILATGDGSINRPWRVLMISDEYDVLQALRKVSIRQELVTTAHGECDRQVCQDGTEYYFELPWLR